MKKNIVRFFGPRDTNGNTRFLYFELHNGEIINITDERPKEQYCLDVRISGTDFKFYMGSAKRAGFIK